MSRSTAALALVIVVAVPVSGGGQGASRPVQSGPARDRPAATAAANAVIRGRVVAADTGRPLSLATITLSAPELTDGQRTISTNSAGRYELRNLPAGRYTISVRRNGYLTTQYGQKQPLERGRPLQIAAGQIVEDVDLAMPRMSVITGRITDDEGEPVVGAFVSAIRPNELGEPIQGRPPPPGEAALGQANTDDTGQYRIANLLPGTYLVGARVNDTWTESAGGTERTFAYSITYFPGTASRTAAKRVGVGLGEEASNIDFSPVPSLTADVSGTVVDSRGRPLAMAIVSVVQDVTGQVAGGARQIARDGTFRIASVKPGDYTLSVSGLPEGPSRVAEGALLPIAVDGRDLTVSVTTSIGWSMAGRVVFDGSVAPGFNSSRIVINARRQTPNLAPILAGIDPRDAFGIGRVKADWTFSVNGIFGPARVEAQAPPGWRMKAVLFDGRDVAGKLLETKIGDSLDGLQVVLTNRVTSVAGRLADESGAPATDATILVFAEDRERWYPASPFVQAARPDQSGRWEIKGLPPGEYLAVAVAGVQDGIWRDPQYLESIRGSAERVSLGDGESRTLALGWVTR